MLNSSETAGRAGDAVTIGVGGGAASSAIFVMARPQPIIVTSAIAPKYTGKVDNLLSEPHTSGDTKSDDSPLIIDVKVPQEI